MTKKHTYLQIGGFLLILLFFYDARAYDFADRSRGVVLYYNILSSTDRTVELTHGDLGNSYEERSYTIPRCVRHKGKRYRVVAVGKRAFARCNNLTNITFHSHITRIDSAAFIGCVSLWKLNLPKHLTYIGDRAFYGCESLSYVEIPRKVDHIGMAAFSQCPEVVDIMVDDRNNRYSDSGGNSCIVDHTTHTLVQGCANTTIPGDVISIAGHAFDGCTSLTSVLLPNKTEHIGSQAFAGCTNIHSITIKAYVPPQVEEDTFPTILFKKAKFMVPGETVSLYIDAPVWKNFTNY